MMGDAVRCSGCGRRVPSHPLDLWLEQHDTSYGELAKQIAAKLGTACTLKSLLYRIAHQAPGYRHKREWTPQVQAVLLDITGLTVKDLQQKLPSGGYALPVQKR